MLAISGARQRDVRLDALRGLAITLVVLGHALQTDHTDRGAAVSVLLGPFDSAHLTCVTVLNVIYAFHMPLFMFISGYLEAVRPRGLKDTLIRKAGTLLIPYFAWFVVSLVLSGQTSRLVPSLASAALTPWTPGVLWFLYTLFQCALLAAVVRTIRDRDDALMFSLIPVMALGLLPDAVTAFGRSQFVWLYPFFIFGSLVQRRRWLLGAKNGLVFALCACVFMVLMPVVWPSIGPGPRWWSPAFPAGVALALFAFARYALAAAAVAGLFVAYQSAHTPLVSAQSWLGKRSLGVYATHSYFLGSIAGKGVVYMLAFFCLSLFASASLTRILESSPPATRLFLGHVPRPHERSDELEEAA